MSNFRELPPDLGPKMRALRDDRRRRFALEMAWGAPSAAEAARRAGYSDASEGAKVTAHHLMQSELVIDAIEECGRLALRGLGPAAITAARAILNNPKHPAHARMIEAVLDRAGHSAKTEHKVTVEHSVDTREIEMLAFRLAKEAGISPTKLLGGKQPKTPAAEQQMIIEGETVLELKGDGTGPAVTAVEQQARSARPGLDDEL